MTERPASGFALEPAKTSTRGGALHRTVASA